MKINRYQATARHVACGPIHLDDLATRLAGDLCSTWTARTQAADNAKGQTRFEFRDLASIGPDHRKQSAKDPMTIARGGRGWRTKAVVAKEIHSP